MLSQVQTVGTHSKSKLNLQDAEHHLFAALIHEVARLMDRSEQVTKLVEGAGLSQRDFVWFEHSDVLYMLTERYIDWPTIIEDQHVDRLYHLISYIKSAMRFGSYLKPVALHLV